MVSTVEGEAIDSCTRVSRKAGSVIFGFSMFAISLVVPQLVQVPEATGYGMGGTILVAGLVMAPNGLLMMSMAPVSGRISNTKGSKVTLMLGAAVVAVGYGLGIVLMSTIWQLVLVSCIIGAGIGLSYGAMPMLIMGAVPVSETAAANSFNTLMRSLGTSIASAVSGVLLAQMTITVGRPPCPRRTASAPSWPSAPPLPWSLSPSPRSCAARHAAPHHHAKPSMGHVTASTSAAATADAPPP